MLYRRFVLLLCTFFLAYSARGQSPEQWAQKVDYDMEITLRADDHQYDGRQTLTYTNNSPDTLDTVYYHLYFNAFHPQSMMAKRNRELPDPDGRIVPRIFNLTPDEQGWHRIHSLAQDGTPVEHDVTDTILRVELADPIPPGATTTFDMTWTAQVPLQTRRSGRDSRGDSIDYTMTQWYPKIAAYDERGWHANFYVNREYYAPVGSFDVHITLPTEYTIGSTGILQNPEEIGHGYDIDGNGSWRPADGLPQADSLTWHFSAKNVHNFAWSADPDYIHDQVSADGTTHHILYKPEVAKQWTPLKNDMPKLTSFFSREYGQYPYPQMTVAQGGDGGMEYPMFTVVSSYDGPEFETKSSRRSVLGTTVHEFAHMWYYAALASNEADYAWMDEGFTSYATSEGMAHLTDGTATHSASTTARYQKLGIFEPLSTPADWFETNLAYGVASYPGGELVVDMLGYVMGDNNKDKWLKRYFRHRKYQHPDPFDLELFAEKESGLMLDWYFWQFTHSARQLDDEIDDLSTTPSGDGYKATFTLEREGKIRMPQDVKLTLEDGSTQWVNVPLATMHGHKPVPDNWIVTEPWPWVQPEKTFTVPVSAPVETAELDPNERTPDVNRLNNSTDIPLNIRFLRGPQSSWSRYEVGIRPLALYADAFGVGGGLQARGTYFTGDHSTRATLTLWPEVLFSDGEDPSLPESAAFLNRVAPGSDPGSWFEGIDYELRYTISADRLSARSTVRLSAQKHLGVMENRLGLRVPLNNLLEEGSHTVRLSGIHQYNPNDRVFGAGRTLFRASSEEIYAEEANYNPFLQSHLVSARLDWSISSGNDRLSLFGEAGGSLKEFARLPSATRLAVEGTQTHDLGLLTARADLRIGVGSEQLALHKRFHLGGRSVEAQWRKDVYRQVSSALVAPVENAHLAGFGPSGPVAYLRTGNGRVGGLVGPNVLSGRLSLNTTPFSSVNTLSPLQLEVFSGLGSTWETGAFFGGFRSENLLGDAGLGARYTLSEIPHLDRWIGQSDFLQELNIVAKFPVWASDPGIITPDQDELEFRWLIGVEL